MQEHSAMGSIARPARSRRRVAPALLAPCLVLAGVALFVGHLRASPPVVRVSPAIPGEERSIVFASGDMGLGRWSMGGQVARRLGEAGYAVVGLDSLAAFSRRRTPREATDLVSRAIRQALDRDPDRRVVLIGQSFGSDVLVMALPQVPATLMQRVDRVVLIVPSTGAYLQVSPAEKLGLSSPDVNLVPLAGRLPPVPVTCIYGVEETDSLCAALGGANVRKIGLPGGHFLRRDSDRLFTVLANDLARGG